MIFFTELVKREVISDLPDGSDGDNDGGESDDTLHDEFCKQRNGYAVGVYQLAQNFMN